MNNFATAPIMATIGLLFLSLTAGATELVGKPVPVGKSLVTSNSAVAASSPHINSAGDQTMASASSQMAEPQVAPVAPVEPIPPVPEINPFEHGNDPFHNVFEEHSNWDRPDLLIPIVAMSLLFGGPVILVIVLAFLYYRAKARRQQNINANIDKLLAAGRDIPIELLMGEEPPLIKTNQPQGTGQVAYAGSEAMMHKGVRNIGLGTGWLLFLTIMFGFKIGSFGFIFIGLGISQVVIWLLSGNRRRAASFTGEGLED